MSLKLKRIGKKITNLESKVRIGYLEKTLEPLKFKQENYRLLIEYFNRKKLKQEPKDSIINLEVLDEQLRVYSKLSRLYDKIGEEGRAAVYEELAEKCEKDILIGERINVSFDEVNELLCTSIKHNFEYIEDPIEFRADEKKSKLLNNDFHIKNAYISINTVSPGENVAASFLRDKPFEESPNQDKPSYLISWSSFKKEQSNTLETTN